VRVLVDPRARFRDADLFKHLNGLFADFVVHVAADLREDLAHRVEPRVLATPAVLMEFETLCDLLADRH